MIVVVDVPDLEGRSSFWFRRPAAGVEQFLGEGSVVSFDLAVVPWGVWADPLVAGGQGGDRPHERLRGVVRAVVGDDPDQPADAVGGEERPGAVEEPDRGRSGLVGQVLGVGQSGVAVDGGVQVDVAGLGALGLGALGGLVRC